MSQTRGTKSAIEGLGTAHGIASTVAARSEPKGPRLGRLVIADDWSKTNVLAQPNLSGTIRMFAGRIKPHRVA